MRIVADLHVHSKYARATSSRCDIVGLSDGAKIKGIDVVATGDFTHPIYFNELRAYLKEEKNGLFPYNGVRFILSTEVSVIYELNGKTKKMHHVLLAPSFETAAQINDRLAKYGNLREDGRPMLSLSSAALVEELTGISESIMIIPAHAWTPWFSIFGSKSGVNSVEEAFEDKAGRIYALETGLSSDPAMNWMVSSLDRYSLISNSDAHSPEKLGREANVFELETPGYKAITDAIKTRKGFVKTYEFYPEEGKYHYDGHRNCKIRWSPWEALKHNDICPVCRKKITVGVLHRVAELADRKEGFRPENAVPFQHIVPLNTVISKVLGKGEQTGDVVEAYSKLIRYFGNEFAVFEAYEDQIRLAATPEIAEGIIRVKKEEVGWLPGYDGVFGELVLDEKGKKEAVERKQKNLSEF
ncbi:DNA helicase UvrD [Candidatus Micrarchaeota archaeon]|nr:DNA helicase UvrD [Candidatus Micrarchaeota archaeon]